MTTPARRSHTRRDRRLAEQVRRRGDNCHLCGRPIDYTLPPGLPGSFEADHIVPHALGGQTTLDNLAASHRACNRAKGAKHPAAHTLRPTAATPTAEQPRCPQGRCQQCHGVHHDSANGVTFVTSRRWTP